MCLLLDDWISVLKIAEYMNCHEVPGKPIEKDEKVGYIVYIYSNLYISRLILGEITVRASTCHHAESNEQSGFSIVKNRFYITFLAHLTSTRELML